MKILTVRELMMTHHASIAPDDTIPTAVKVLIDYHLSALPVVDGARKLVGILSEADCLRASLVGGYHNESVALVRDLMSTELDVISPELELSAATDAFLQKRRRMIPVVEAGTLIGLLSRKDLLGALG